MKFTENQVKELLKSIKVAKVQNIKKHENADRLFIVNIDAGDDYDFKNEDGTIQIVTAADNVKEGDMVPYLAPGNVVPGLLFKEGERIQLESRPMRGEISHGMILAQDEIGMGNDHEGILILQSDDSSIGKSIIDVMPEILNKTMESVEVMELTPEMQKKYDLITNDLAELIGDEDLISILAERDLKVYYGTAPTGKMHLGHMVQAIKIAELLEAGCEVTILLANIHAYLDNMKSDWDILEYRTEYYEKIFKEMLKLVGVPLEKLKFIKGTEFQLSKEYTLDLYKLTAMVSLRDARKGGAEVVKQVESPLLSSMLYPLLQSLDEEHLHADAQLGGLDQRKIFMLARTYLPKIGYKKRVHLMTPLVPGLGKSGKMSSSEPNSKIDFDDSDEIIKDKLNKAFSVDGEVEGNGLLAMLKYVVFKVLKKKGKEFKVSRPEQYGGDIIFKTYEDLEKAFAEKKLSSVDLKPALAEEIIRLIQPLREFLESNSTLMGKAYPVKD